jgi:hypothetical protein
MRYLVPEELAEEVAVAAAAVFAEEVGDVATDLLALEEATAPLVVVDVVEIEDAVLCVDAITAVLVLEDATDEVTLVEVPGTASVVGETVLVVTLLAHAAPAD